MQRIISHEQQEIIGVAMEDNVLVLDPRDLKSVRIIDDVNDVSDIKFLSDSHSLLVSTHSGDLYLWDLRNLKKLHQLIGVHEKKFDEGILSVGVHAGLPFFATGGADQVIRVFEANN